MHLKIKYGKHNKNLIINSRVVLPLLNFKAYKCMTFKKINWLFLLNVGISLLHKNKKIKTKP